MPSSGRCRPSFQQRLSGRWMDEALRGPVGCLPRHDAQREVGDLAKRQRWRAICDHS